MVADTTSFRIDMIYDVLQDRHDLLLGRITFDAELGLDLFKIRIDRSCYDDVVLDLIVDAGYDGLSDVRTQRQQILDLFREYVLAVLGDDDVLLTARDDAEAVLINVAQVAGRSPV